ncbi:MAG: ribosome maturation factor RimP [Epsilonproteobacteria bacterium]|nr:ribosome maturation factor RimP [Campylobacterota bacterium]
MIMETIKNIIEENGAIFYDSEIVSESGIRIFRIFITAKDGITLDLCAKISRIISPIIDLNPPVSGTYTLEVSSPGIERSLKSDSHFKGSIGENVKIKLINTDKIIGKLNSYDGKSLEIIEDDGQTRKINIEDIDKARTYYKW